MIPVVAIDGPAGSGKGTMARELAGHFGFAYLDTGLLYRTVAYLDLPTDRLSVLTMQELIEMKSQIPDDELRSDENSIKTSIISARPEIRIAMNRLQREFACSPGKNYSGAVLDGRDIGTVIAPDAACKLFITADLQIRARRRFDELVQTNPQLTFEEVYSSLELRDSQDASRKNAPMKYDASYVVIDTSNDTIQESFDKIVEIVRKAFVAAGFKIYSV